MYFVELKILRDRGAPLTLYRQASHSVHQSLYQALGALLRPFFEDNGLVDIGSARLPQLMTELTCLRSEPLPTSEALRLEARLSCASEVGFSVDYNFYAESDARLLAAWRSLHLFYDLALEQPLVFQTSLKDRSVGRIGPGSARVVTHSAPPIMRIESNNPIANGLRERLVVQERRALLKALAVG